MYIHIFRSIYQSICLTICLWRETEWGTHDPICTCTTFSKSRSVSRFASAVAAHALCSPTLAAIAASLRASRRAASCSRERGRPGGRITSQITVRSQITSRSQITIWFIVSVIAVPWLRCSRLVARLAPRSELFPRKETA